MLQDSDIWISSCSQRFLSIWGLISHCHHHVSSKRCPEVFWWAAAPKTGRKRNGSQILRATTQICGWDQRGLQMTTAVLKSDLESCVFLHKVLYNHTTLFSNIWAGYWQWINCNHYNVTTHWSQCGESALYSQTSYSFHHFQYLTITQTQESIRTN